jgi:hypothetical protein
MIGSGIESTTFDPSRPRQHPRQSSSIKSFRFLRRHTFAGCRSHDNIAAIVSPLACLSCCLTSVAAVAAAASASVIMDAGDIRQRRHPLHRRLGNDDGFTGKWDGQWTASSSAEYGCDGSNCNDDDGRSEGWIDNVDPEALTPEQIVTYVSLGILGFMTLLCLVCYPEIIAVPCKSLRDWCFSPLMREVDGGGGVGKGGGGGLDGVDYVGGRAEAETDTPTKK